MGILSAITGLFGGSDNAVKTIDKVGSSILNGIDAVIYTDQEKAEATQKKMQLFVEFAKTAYEENSIRSVTRRWLAFLVMGPTMAMFVGTALAYPFSPESAAFLFGLFKEMALPSSGVLAFYFGPHLIGALRK